MINLFSNKHNVLIYLVIQKRAKTLIEIHMYFSCNTRYGPYYNCNWLVCGLHLFKKDDNSDELRLEVVHKWYLQNIWPMIILLKIFFINGTYLLCWFLKKYDINFWEKWLNTVLNFSWISFVDDPII